MEAHGVGIQDEHLIPTPNGWANREGEFSYPKILKELCGNRSTRFGGPFGIARVLLQQFKALGKKGHTFSIQFTIGDKQVTNRAYDLGHKWATLD